MNGKPIEILLVEDNEADVELTCQGLLKGKIANHLHVVEHGGQAISFLRREGQFSDAPRPDLVLLDIHMPHVDGRQVLRHMKQSQDLCDIPVVILSSLAEPDEIKDIYRLHANAYMTKPVNFEQFVTLVQNVSEYWFTMVKLPPKGRPAETQEASAVENVLS